MDEQESFVFFVPSWSRHKKKGDDLSIVALEIALG
jgi:hypothetical protein